MKEYPALKNIKINKVFLDNTFCNPKYVFPPQSEAISNIIDIVRKEVLFIISKKSFENSYILFIIILLF